MFLLPYEILNAPREKITFLCNFCHLFPVLFYELNTSINDPFQFFFLGILSWKAALLFNGEGYGLWLRWVSFLIGGVPHWGYTKRGVFKIIGWGVQPFPLWENLIYQCNWLWKHQHRHRGMFSSSGMYLQCYCM